MPIRGVVFDLGQTLVTQEPLVGSPSNHFGAAAIASLVRPFLSTELTDEQLAETLGETMQESLVEAYQGECATPDAHRIFREVFDDLDWEAPSDVIDVLLPAYFKPHFDAMQAVPQAAKVLQLLQEAGVRTAMITNLLYGEDLLIKRLGALELIQRLDVLVISTESGWFKPHPAMYRAAAERLELPFEELVMVGDDWDIDVLGPQRLGMRAIWLKSADARPEGEVPAAIIEGLGDLIPAIAVLEASDRVA
jgi:putative hydrolase of the HAD superfamily